MKRRLLAAACVVVIGLSVGCGVRHAHQTQVLPRQARWVALPWTNLADTPQAGERAEAILTTLLRARGIQPDLPPVEGFGADLALADGRQRAEHALSWARKEGFAFAITGTVTEWSYRSGPEGEPAVGLSVMVVELPGGEVVWSASGARSGWAREPVSGAAQVLLEELLAKLDVR